MQFSESWLRSFANPDLDTRQLGHLLTMAGLEVEAIEPAAPSFTRVVVAQIRSVAKHPDADRLQICEVDVGEGAPLSVVCGAANARAGLKTACARVGAGLPGIEIRHAKVRGIESFGMLCSARELGIAEDADGILELPDDAPLGVDIRTWMELDDQRITLKLTPNRGDCLSLEGLAREVAALADVPLARVECAPVPALVDDAYPLEIEAPEACPRYCGRVLRGIDSQAATPRWMVRRLERSGLRAIHPVVDVTNYVLLELGQPMHAFDLSRLRGPVRARMAHAGESLTLLNEQDIALDGDALVIADDQGALALAGIMGGAASAVSTTTVDLFLEAAHFTPDAIAGRARRYALSSDSAQRFERGVDPDLPARAMERATRLILDICGGACGPSLIAGPGVAPAGPIAFRPARARRILGLDVSDSAMLEILARLGMEVTGMEVTGMGEAVRVTPPSHRFDITREVDLIEEVARVHGYDAIPPARPRGEHVMLSVSETARSVLELKNLMVARGYQEIITYSFIAETLDADFRIAGRPLPLLNPIASQMGVMRGSLLGGLVQTLRHNLNHGQERLRVFEVGRAFLADDADGQPTRLAALAYGDSLPEQWGETARGVDFFDLRADVEAMLSPARLTFRRGEHAALHPGQCAQIVVDGAAIGWLGSLHPRLAQQYGFARVPVLCELDLAGLTRRPAPRYAGMPRFPAVRRDIAVVVDAAVPVAEMLASVMATRPALLAEISCFDLYQGQGVEPGKKSLAFNMLLQHTEKTLTDSEIEISVAEVVDILLKNHHAILRS